MSGEERKTRKSRSEEKVVGFSSVSLFPGRKREAVIRAEYHMDTSPSWKFALLVQTQLLDADIVDFNVLVLKFTVIFLLFVFVYYFRGG